VDCYEIEGAKDCGDKVFVTAQLAHHVVRTKNYAKKKKEGKANKEKGEKSKIIAGGYTWKEEIMLPALENVYFPEHKDQVPDLFINVFTEGFFSTTRVGYVRLNNEKGEMDKDSKPKWHHLLNPKNNVDGHFQGRILLNA